MKDLHRSGGGLIRGCPGRQSNEDTLKSETLQIERKTFVLTLKENPRGRFLRITEDVGGRRDTIIIPVHRPGGIQKGAGRNGEGGG